MKSKSHPETEEKKTCKMAHFFSCTSWQKEALFGTKTNGVRQSGKVPVKVRTLGITLIACFFSSL